MQSIQLMEEILHQLIGSLPHYLQSFIHSRWCRISSINRITQSPIHEVETNKSKAVVLSFRTRQKTTLSQGFCCNSTDWWSNSVKNHLGCKTTAIFFKDKLAFKWCRDLFHQQDQQWLVVFPSIYIAVSTGVIFGICW